MGFLFEHGTGVTQDSTQAILWYKQAADSGYGKAMGNLGRVYEEGDIVKKDPAQAYLWLKLGAFQGDQSAMHQISEYLAGHVFTDDQKAEGDRMAAAYRSEHNQAPLAGPIPTVVTPGMLELAKAKADAGNSVSAGAGSAAGATGANSTAH